MSPRSFARQLGVKVVSVLFALVMACSFVNAVPQKAHAAVVGSSPNILTVYIGGTCIWASDQTPPTALGSVPGVSVSSSGAHSLTITVNVAPDAPAAATPLGPLVITGGTADDTITIKASQYGGAISFQGDGSAPWGIDIYPNDNPNAGEAGIMVFGAYSGTPGSTFHYDPSLGTPTLVIDSTQLTATANNAQQSSSYNGTPGAGYNGIVSNGSITVSQSKVTAIGSPGTTAAGGNGIQLGGTLTVSNNGNSTVTAQGGASSLGAGGNGILVGVTTSAGAQSTSTGNGAFGTGIADNGGTINAHGGNGVTAGGSGITVVNGSAGSAEIASIQVQGQTLINGVGGSASGGQGGAGVVTNGSIAINNGGRITGEGADGSTNGGAGIAAGTPVSLAGVSGSPVNSDPSNGITANGGGTVFGTGGDSTAGGNGGSGIQTSTLDVTGGAGFSGTGGTGAGDKGLGGDGILAVGTVDVTGISATAGATISGTGGAGGAGGDGGSGIQTPAAVSASGGAAVTGQGGAAGSGVNSSGAAGTGGIGIGAGAISGTAGGTITGKGGAGGNPGNTLVTGGTGGSGISVTDDTAIPAISATNGTKITGTGGTGGALGGTGGIGIHIGGILPPQSGGQSVVVDGGGSSVEGTGGDGADGSGTIPGGDGGTGIDTGGDSTTTGGGSTTGTGGNGGDGGSGAGGNGGGGISSGGDIIIGGGSVNPQAGAGGSGTPPGTPGTPIDPNPKDPSGNTLYEVILHIKGGPKNTAVDGLVVVNPDGSPYNTTGIMTDASGQAHLWLTPGSVIKSVSINGITYPGEPYTVSTAAGQIAFFGPPSGAANQPGSKLPQTGDNAPLGSSAIALLLLGVAVATAAAAKILAAYGRASIQQSTRSSPR